MRFHYANRKTVQSKEAIESNRRDQFKDDNHKNNKFLFMSLTLTSPIIK